MRPRPSWTLVAVNAHGWSEIDVDHALAIVGDTVRTVEITANKLTWRNERGEQCTHYRFCQPSTVAVDSRTEWSAVTRGTR